jgi:hypothetical protein
MGPRSGWSQRARHPVRRRPAEVSPRFGDERPHSDENDGMHGTEPCKRRMQPPVGYENDVCRASMAGLAVPDLDRCGDGLDASGYRRRVFLRITRHRVAACRNGKCSTITMRYCSIAHGMADVVSALEQDGGRPHRVGQADDIEDLRATAGPHPTSPSTSTPASRPREFRAMGPRVRSMGTVATCVPAACQRRCGQPRGATSSARPG